MTIHREGYKIIGITAFLFCLANIIVFTFLSPAWPWLTLPIFIITLAFFLFVISFFRIPKRTPAINKNQIICPADGKVVTIEEITDDEYFKDKRIQVSIFMSPANVHANWCPVEGAIKYSTYHRGKYLVAWHPKSSTENERHSVVIENEKGTILVKQIAGAVAKRICNYLSPGQNVRQCDELGFIKFGSRVDVLLPLNAKVQVQLNEKVKGSITVLASW